MHTTKVKNSSGSLNDVLMKRVLETAESEKVKNSTFLVQR